MVPVLRYTSSNVSVLEVVLQTHITQFEHQYIGGLGMLGYSHGGRSHIHIEVNPGTLLLNIL